MGFLISISHARGQRELSTSFCGGVDPALKPTRPGADQGGIKVAACGDFGHDPGLLAPSSISPVWAMSNVVVRWRLYKFIVQVQARQTAGQE